MTGFVLVYSGQVPLNRGEELLSAWRAYRQLRDELRRAWRESGLSILQIARRLGADWREVYNRIVVGVVADREFWSRRGGNVPLRDVANVVFVLGDTPQFGFVNLDEQKRLGHLERALGLAPYRIDWDYAAGEKYACYAGGRRVRL